MVDADIINVEEHLFREKRVAARDSLVLHRLSGLVSSLNSRGTLCKLLCPSQPSQQTGRASPSLGAKDR